MPSVVVPSLNVTFPVGLAPDTVAVSTTVWATCAGLGLTASAVVLVTFVTANEVVDEVLLALPVSPPYEAVRLCAPEVVNVVEYVALPKLIWAEPRVVVPSLNVTVPMGLEPVTVAVKTTVCPTKAGLGLAASEVDVVVRALTLSD